MTAECHAPTFAADKLDFSNFLLGKIGDLKAFNPLNPSSVLSKFALPQSNFPLVKAATTRVVGHTQVDTSA
jgi:hypothetical protein